MPKQGKLGMFSNLQEDDTLNQFRDWKRRKQGIQREALGNASISRVNFTNCNPREREREGGRERFTSKFPHFFVGTLQPL